MAAAAAAAADSVKLLNFWPSMFGLRVHYALDLKGVEYEYQEEDFPTKGKSQELLEANPVYKKVPVLIHNGKPICESLIIVEYIDSVWPQHKLLPSDPYERAVARFWADFSDKKIYETGSKIVKTKGDEQKQGAEDMKEILKTLDKALDKVSPGKPFFGGDSMNFADVGVAPFICWFQAYESLAPELFKVPGAEECPHLHRWIAAVKEVDAIKKSVPDSGRVAELAAAIRKRVLGE